MRIRYFILLVMLCCSLVSAQPEEGKSNDFLSPSGGQLGIGGKEGFGLGTAVGDPTALYGPTRTSVVLFGTDRESLIDLTGYYAQMFGEERRLLLEYHIDPNFLGADLSYTISPKSWEGALTANVWVGSGSFAPFDIKGTNVVLPGGGEPHLQNVGGGIEYVQPFTEDLDVAFGLNYNQYGFSTDQIGGSIYGVDENFEPLTVSNKGSKERFLSFRVNGLYSTLDDRNLPTQGTKIRFGLEQAVELGSSTTSFNRLSTNIAQLIRMPGFNDGKHSLVLNLQAGTILGNPPPIRAFHLGGAHSVRGYSPGEMASGKSFVQASAEYRHQLGSFSAFDSELTPRLALFYDYGSVLGTSDQLRGFPGNLSGKPEDGHSYGLGLHLGSEYGLFRLESAWNDQGRNSIYFTVGEQF